jgi:hypothetical protein
MDCAVCASHEFGVVHSMLEAGASPEAIAGQTSLQLDDIEWHAANCVSFADDGPDTLEKSDQRIRDLAQRIAVAGTAAGLQGDVKSQLQALSAALRAETEIRHALEARAADARQDANAPVTVASLDELMREFDRSTDPRVRLSAEVADRPDEAQAFRYLLQHPDLCRAVMNLIVEYRESKETVNAPAV